MHFGPGHVSFEHGNMATRVKDHKVGKFRWRKVIRKGLKRARMLLSGIRRLQSNTIFRWMELSLSYSIACVDQQSTDNVQSLPVRCNNACTVTERHRHSVKEAFSKGNGIKEMAFWWNFEAKLKDSDVKFKIHYKYGYARIEHKFGLS